MADVEASLRKAVWETLDDVARLALADFLEEQGREKEALPLRGQIEGWLPLYGPFERCHRLRLMAMDSDLAFLAEGIGASSVHWPARGRGESREYVLAFGAQEGLMKKHFDVDQFEARWVVSSSKLITSIPGGDKIFRRMRVEAEDYWVFPPGEGQGPCLLFEYPEQLVAAFRDAIWLEEQK